MYKLDLQSNMPIYRQIVEQTKEMLIRKILQDGERMPSIRELATILSINPTTVAKAYEEMEREGIIVKVQGKGSFISYDDKDVEMRIDENFKSLVHSFKELKLLGLNDETILNKISKILEEIG